MINDVARLRELRREGLGCAQVMIAMGIEAFGEDNPRFVDTAFALCYGAHCGGLCGALSGAGCLCSMFNKEEAAANIIPELSAWFQNSYGSINCPDILRNNPANRSLICPELIEKTYLKAKELLLEYGYDIEEYFGNQ